MKFNTSKRDYIILKTKDALDESLNNVEVGILVIFECISSDGFVNENLFNEYIDQDNHDLGRQLADKFGYTIVEDGTTAKAKRKVVSKIFTKPTLNEVRQYMFEIGMPNAETTSEKFVNYYNTNGWMVGRSKMKDWKSACITWKSRVNHDSLLPSGMLRVYARGSQKPIVITKEEYDRSIKSGTNYYRLQP
jgi:hypothetical protein